MGQPIASNIQNVSQVLSAPNNAVGVVVKTGYGTVYTSNALGQATVAGQDVQFLLGLGWTPVYTTQTLLSPGGRPNVAFTGPSGITYTAGNTGTAAIGINDIAYALQIGWTASASSGGIPITLAGSVTATALTANTATVGTNGGFLQINSSGYAVGQWVPRTNSIANLLSTIGNAGELACATDIPAVMQFTGTVAGGKIAYFGCSLAYVNASIPGIVNTAQNGYSLPTSVGLASVTINPSTNASGGYAGGSSDVVIGNYLNTSTVTPVLGTNNIVIGTGKNIALNGATGSAFQNNVLIGVGAIITDGYSYNNCVIGSTGILGITQLSFCKQSSNIGSNGFSVSGTGITGTSLIDSFASIGSNNNTVLANALTPANTGSYMTQIGTYNVVTGGADNLAVIGSSNNWGLLSTDLMSGGGCIGVSLQDAGMNNAAFLSSSSSLLRVGNGCLPNLGFGTECIIDFLTNAVGTGAAGVNGNLILLGSAKQYNAVPLNATASARGTLSGGRGANVAYQFGFADQGYTVSAITANAATHTVPDGCSTVVMMPNAVYATHTEQFPPNPIDGLTLTFTNGSAFAMTSFSVSTNAGQSVTGGSPFVVGAVAVGAVACKYMYCKSGAVSGAPANTWVRVG